MIDRDQVLDMTFQRVISVPETCHFSHVRATFVLNCSIDLKVEFLMQIPVSIDRKIDIYKIKLFDPLNIPNGFDQLNILQ